MAEEDQPRESVETETHDAYNNFFSIYLFDIFYAKNTYLQLHNRTPQ